MKSSNANTRASAPKPTICGSIFDAPHLREQLAEVEKKASDPNFWSNQELSQQAMRERKRIEAQGIHDFQQIVAQGISPQLLEWKGIEATENLAKSANAKVVVIGNSKNGLPLILGQ